MTPGDGRAAAGVGPPRFAASDVGHEQDTTPERALVIRELDAIVACRFIDPEGYAAWVDLGRRYTEPHTLTYDPDSGNAVDDDSVALRLRNIRGYLASAVFGACCRCYCPVFTFPDGRRLTWPALDHHNGCDDVAEAAMRVVPVPEPAPDRTVAPHRQRRVVVA